MMVVGYYVVWKAMSSGVPLGSWRAGPNYINDLGENVQGLISTFANYTKIGIIHNEDGYLDLQQDLDQFDKWDEGWQMEFI